MTTHRLLPTLLVCLTAGLLLLPASSGPQSAGVGLTPGQTMTSLPAGRSLILGGWGSRGATGTAFIYDVRSGRTTALAPISPARAGHSATVLRDGTVPTLGGLAPRAHPGRHRLQPSAHCRASDPRPTGRYCSATLDPGNDPSGPSHRDAAH